MAHFHFDDQTPYGRLFRRWLNAIETVIDEGPDVIAVMDEMRTGAANLEASFSVVATRFGFANNADAKSAYDEAQSANSKTNSDGSVSGVNAAFRQVIARLR